MELILYGLFVYRVARLLTRENGPFDILERFRRLFGKLSYKNMLWKSVAELLICPYCLGVWISAIIVWVSGRSDLQYVLWVFSVSGLQTLLQVYEDNYEKD